MNPLNAPVLVRPRAARRAGAASRAARVVAFVLALAASSALGLAGAAASSPSASPTPSAAASADPGQHVPPPVLAYYYMWFNTASWSHAKTDLPSLGGYTSTDPAVIRQQVAWAKEAGVDAFIASWKSTPSLNLALSELVAECHSQGLKLVLIYEGLDVNRNPIPTSTVASDLTWFEANYGTDPVFDVFGKPAVIWSGSWQFSDADIAAVRTQLGAPDKLLLLGSEKTAAAYQPRDNLFDGDAYYWSSADPLSTPNYQKHLNSLAAAVHAAHGLWLAPAAVGFDARLNGGSSIVDRRNGVTLTNAWDDAMASGPDAVAVISWNEYTENSYVEPSRLYGDRYLKVLSLLTGASGPAPTSAASPQVSPTPVDTASPAAGATGRGGATGGGTTTGGPGRPSTQYDWTASLLFAALIFAVLGWLAFNFRSRARRDHSDDDRGAGSGLTGKPDSLGRPIR